MSSCFRLLLLQQPARGVISLPASLKELTASILQGKYDKNVFFYSEQASFQELGSIFKEVSKWGIRAPQTPFPSFSRTLVVEKSVSVTV